MDPRISTLHWGAPALFSLESIATHLSHACVVITTSNCKVQIPEINQSQILREDVVYQHIYNSSLPLFQKMIQRGLVRVIFLDHQKYKLPSCDNFYNPSAAMMHINYWGSGQFIDGVDSDMVLVIQNDSLLCNEFNLGYLKISIHRCNLANIILQYFVQVMERIHETIGGLQR